MISPLLLAGVASACGGAKAPTAPEPVSSAAAQTDAAAPAPKKPSEDDVRAAVAPKTGEEPADAKPIPGLVTTSAADEALLAKCSAAKDKALERTKKQPFDKQLAAATKAMDAVSKRCLDLALGKQTSGAAQIKDGSAQLEMRAIAKALAKSPDACGAGAPNPAAKMGACMMGIETILWDREGWSCVSKQLSDQDKSVFGFKASYVYSFTTDATLGTWEVVGQGCSMMLGSGGGFAETELVMRGRSGEDVDKTIIYRRAPSEKKDKAEKRPDWANPDHPSH